MISILPTPETPVELEYPVGDDVRRQAKDDRYSMKVSSASVETSFDLFAEARQIYARARATQRVRSSRII